MERPFICGARLTAGNFYSSVLWYLSLSVPCSICAPSLFNLVLTLVSYCFTSVGLLLTHALSIFYLSLLLLYAGSQNKESKMSIAVITCRGQTNASLVDQKK